MQGEKRKELRSPVAQYSIQDMLDKASYGGAATARATYNQPRTGYNRGK